MGKIIGSILGLLAIINGFSILTDKSCDSVSFGGQGGGRVMVATCFQDGSGALPGSVAGLGMIVLGGLIAFFSIKNLS
jgi:hypothetical protein